ncbi:MAG: hypothetical protein ACOZFS_06075 [Thermodesulfobacteriota bacterium]
MNQLPPTNKKENRTLRFIESGRWFVWFGFTFVGILVFHSLRKDVFNETETLLGVILGVITIGLGVIITTINKAAEDIMTRLDKVLDKVLDELQPDG